MATPVSTGVTAATAEPETSAQRARRARIIQATLALASRGGYEAVQMREVAERSEVALGTLYRYFPSKVHLLVSAMAHELERMRVRLQRKAIPGTTRQERVSYVLERSTHSLQRDPNLTEALTRAFMFADASVANEIHVVGMHVTRMLMRALKDPETPSEEIEPTEEDIAIAKVIGDVWLASLVQWVTGRASAVDVSKSMETAVRLLLR